MKTTEIPQFKTVCKGSKALALEMVKATGAKVTSIVQTNFKYLGKAVAFYDGEIQLAFLNASSYKGVNRLELVVPSFSPIYS